MPPHLIDRFFEKAVINCDDNGKIVETLGLVVGSKTSTTITARELVFPSQSGTASQVDDLGKSLNIS